MSKRSQHYAPPLSSRTPAKGFDPEQPEEEIRRYRFSSLAVRYERELLEEQDTGNFHGLLCNVADSLAAFTALMENVDAEADFDGKILHLLGRELGRISDLVFRMQDAYSTVELMEA